MKDLCTFVEGKGVQFYGATAEYPATIVVDFTLRTYFKE